MILIMLWSYLADSKLDSKNHLSLLPELADLHNCNNTLYFEARRHEDLYLWAAKTPNGPSVKMHVQNVHTMDELKMTGNCLKGSRGLLSFDKGFEETEWGRLIKEMFTHVSCPGSLLSSFLPFFLLFSGKEGVCACVVGLIDGRLGRFSAYRHKRAKPNLSSTIFSRSPSSTTKSGSATSR